MEADRYQQSHALFIVGVMSLVLSLGLSFFTAFMLPHLIFGWRYSVPSFIFYTREWLASTFGVTMGGAYWIIFGFLAGLSLIFGIVANVASTRVDRQIYAIKEEELEADVEDAPSKPRLKKSKDSLRFFFTMLGMVIIAYSATVVFHWMISTY